MPLAPLTRSALRRIRSLPGFRTPADRPHPPEAAFAFLGNPTLRPAGPASALHVRQGFGKNVVSGAGCRELAGALPGWALGGDAALGPRGSG